MRSTGVGENDVTPTEGEGEGEKAGEKAVEDTAVTKD